jgi:DNA helicase-2/ATP-dependent DNA helicase PcrA
VERAAERGLYAGGGYGGGESNAVWSGGTTYRPHRPPTIEAPSWKVAERKSSGASFQKGDRVFHDKFGNGTVIAVDDNKLEIAFDKAGTKKVLENFVSAA